MLPLLLEGPDDVLGFLVSVLTKAQCPSVSKM